MVRRTTEAPWEEPSSPFLTASRSPAKPPGSPASVARFDNQISLAKGPVLPEPMYSEHLCVAMDCEMVGVGPYHISVLARVSIVDFQGKIVYDTFIKVEEKVTDYRTAVSGIRPENLSNGVPYGKCRSQVRKILTGKILVGHGLQNDLAILNLRHPPHMIRDTSLYMPYMKDFGSGVVRSRSLRELVRDFCGQTIQDGEHDSVEDSRAAMMLYALSKKEWDSTASTSSFVAPAYNMPYGRNTSRSFPRQQHAHEYEYHAYHPQQRQPSYHYHLPATTFY